MAELHYNQPAKDELHITGNRTQRLGSDKLVELNYCTTVPKGSPNGDGTILTIYSLESPASVQLLLSCAIFALLFPLIGHYLPELISWSCIYHKSAIASTVNSDCYLKDVAINLTQLIMLGVV